MDHSLDGLAIFQPDPLDADVPLAPPPEASDPARALDAVAYLRGVTLAGGTGDAIPSGFPSIDALLGGGLRRGDLTVLTGDVGSGKSALALGIALRAAAGGRSTACFSGESSAERLHERALAMQGRLRIEDIRHGRLDDAAHAAAAAAALRMRHRPTLLAHLPPNGVGGLSDLLVEHLGLDLLVVDPLQALALGHRPLAEELAQGVRDLKTLAVRRHCAVLLVAHLEVALHERPDPRPRLADLGALGALRQLPDVVLALHRDELHRPSRDVDGAAELHVLKQRDGGTGYADLYFHKAWLRFEDLVDPDR